MNLSTSSQFECRNGQTDGSPSMAGIALQMPVNRAGAVEYEN
jgi:hypothetical protein